MNKQLKLLKKIKRADVYDYSHSSQEIIDIIKYLRSLNYVSCNEEKNIYGEPTGHNSCTISQLGICYINEHRQTTLLHVVPIIISVISLIISIIALV